MFLLGKPFKILYWSQSAPRDVTELIVNELERSIVNRIRELDVCEEEYVLLKLVLLFSHKESLGGESNEMMIRLRGKYVQILLHYAKTRFPSTAVQSKKALQRRYNPFRESKTRRISRKDW
nr:unnamed protein product [Haemonchus contortus]